MPEVKLPVIPAVPAVPGVPAVPTIPGTLPPSSPPAPVLPSPTTPGTPAIQKDVILQLGVTISGCLDSGRICVHGLPVTIAGNKAVGAWGAARFEFVIP